MYNCVHGPSPSYLQNLMCSYIPGHAGLRSAKDTTRLYIPDATTKTYGDKCFSVLGPRLWNSIPAYIREAPNVKLFKKHLKTHIFPKE